MRGGEINGHCHVLQRKHFFNMIPHIFNRAFNGIECFGLAAVVEFVAETKRVEVLPQAHVGIQQIVVAVAAFQVSIYLRK